MVSWSGVSGYLTAYTIIDAENKRAVQLMLIPPDGGRMEIIWRRQDWYLRAEDREVYIPQVFWTFLWIMI